MTERFAARRRGFTLMELLVVMGIIALLSGITALAYRAVAKDSKLSSAKNTLMAVLDNARALAMRNNDIVIVAFRPRLDGKQQYVEAVLAKWSRQSCPYFAPFGLQVIDRYVPIANVEPRRLPVGIQVAAPRYGESFDNQWIMLSHFPSMNPTTGFGEAAGAIIGVMYSPNGRNIMYNAKSDAQRIWIDFNNDKLQQSNGSVLDYSVMPPPNVPQAQYDAMFQHTFEGDEPAIALAPFLAVCDDDQVRELNDPSQWNMLVVGGYLVAYNNRIAAYTEYITNNADRIHFNRYTGVAMK